MTEIRYSGTFEKEISYFTGHDKTVIAYLDTVAKNIGILNKSWNDDNSNKYLNDFNTQLTTIKEYLDACHVKIADYFREIQNVLDIAGNASHIELPELGNFEISSILESRGDGSIAFSTETFAEALSTLYTTTREAIADIEDFTPVADSVSGSSEDFYGAVQSNLTAAARSYDPIGNPLTKITRIVKEVQELYGTVSSKVISATASGAGTNTNMTM